MPRNPQKRRCSVPGCRAWAKHGEEMCASHLRSRALREDADFILPLLRAATRAARRDAPDSVEVLDEELRNLNRARALFMVWLHRLDEREEEPGTRIKPAQFLRAWNDSSARVIQLLRARHDLVGDQEGRFGPLMDEVYDLLEDEFPQAGTAQLGFESLSKTCEF